MDRVKLNDKIKEAANANLKTTYRKKKEILQM